MLLPEYRLCTVAHSPNFKVLTKQFPSNPALSVKVTVWRCTKDSFVKFFRRLATIALMSANDVPFITSRSSLCLFTSSSIWLQGGGVWLSSKPLVFFLEGRFYGAILGRGRPFFFTSFFSFLNSSSATCHSRRCTIAYCMRLLGLAGSQLNFKLLFNRFLIFERNQLDMAWGWHIWVDSSMSTVCAAPLFLCLVRLDVRYVEWINIQTFQISITLGVFKQNYDVFSRFDRLASLPIWMHVLGLSSLSNTFTEVGEMYGLLVDQNIIQIPFGLSQRQLPNDMSSLPSILEMNSEIWVLGLATLGGIAWLSGVIHYSGLWCCCFLLPPTTKFFPLE